MARQTPGTAPRRKFWAPRPPRAVQIPRVAAPVPDIRWPARRPMQSRCRGRTGNSTHRATSKLFRYTVYPDCFAKLAARRHRILKERLTAERPEPARGRLRSREIVRKFDSRMAYLRVIR